MTLRPAPASGSWLAIGVLLAGLLWALPLTSVAAGADDHAGFAQRVVELTNAERQQAGLTRLALNLELSTAAQTYSQVLATSDCFEHTCGPVPNFSDRFGKAGYVGWTLIGENIAEGYPTPEAVVAGWMSSAGHRDNILAPQYTEIGVGVVSGGGEFGVYWTEDFGARPNVALSAESEQR